MRSLQLSVVLSLALVAVAAAGPVAEPIREVTLPAQKTLVVRIVAPPERIEAEMTAAMMKVVGFAMTTGIDITGAPFARYFPPEDGRVVIEAGVPVRGDVAGQPSLDIAAGTLPAGPALEAMHRGPYDGLEARQKAVEQWATARGKRIAGAPWHVFEVNQAGERDPQKWRTRILVPLAAVDEAKAKK